MLFHLTNDASYIEWDDVIANDLLQLLFCVWPLAEKYSGRTLCSIGSLMAGMNPLSIEVEAKSRQTVPNLFAVTFDRCSFVSTPYFTMLALWLRYQEINGYCYALLFFRHFYESKLSIASPEDTLNEFLQWYGNHF